MGELIDKVKGRIKQVEGDLTDDKALHTEGVIDELTGKVKGVVKRVEHAIKDITKK